MNKGMDVIDSKNAETGLHATLDGVTPWLAIRIYSLRQRYVAAFFDERKMEYFIPMHWDIRIDDEGHRTKKLKPVVSNIIFLKQTLPEKEIRKIISECPHPVSILKRTRNEDVLQYITAREMEEFIQICNPDVWMRKFISEEEAKLKPGQRVVVERGPLAGVTGRLVRQSHMYFLLKEIPGVAVMLKVSKWCCKALEE